MRLSPVPTSLRGGVSRRGNPLSGLLRSISGLSFKAVLFLIPLFTFVACDSDVRMDASSEESIRESVMLIMKDLDKDKQKEFEVSLRLIMFEGVENIFDLAAVSQNEAISLGAFQAKIDGKTADEIIDEAKQIRASKENLKAPKERAGVPISADSFIQGQ